MNNCANCGSPKNDVGECVYGSLCVRGKVKGAWSAPSHWTPKGDPINHQDYYGGDTTYEVLKVIEAWGLPYHLGCVCKYMVRAGRKDPSKEIEDLKKAQVYLERYIKMRESKGE